MTRASPSAARRTRRRRGGAPGAVLRSPVRPFKVRRATGRDETTLVRHRRAMWKAIGRGTDSELDRHDRVYRVWMARERRARRFYAFLAQETRGAILGSGAVWLMPAQPRPGRRSPPTTPYILSMFTEPGQRGRGVASAIVRALVDWAQRHGYPRVVLHASRMGRGVYARLGFESSNEMRLDLSGPAAARAGSGRPRARR